MSGTADEERRAAALAASTAMEPVAGTVDVDIPADKLWAAFSRPDLWPRWNRCMLFVRNRELVLGDHLVWAFEPIEWWLIYKLPAIATIVDLDPDRKVTWEITAVPGFYARHSFTVEDLGGGRSRFGSWEQAMGPTLEATKAFWIAHFSFVRDASLEGARLLEDIYQEHGSLDEELLPPKSYLATAATGVAVAVALIGIRRRLRRRSAAPAAGAPNPGP
jgi:hypothetical protein